MDFEDLKNPELQEKLKSSNTFEELVALAKEEGIELTDDQLEAISGGGKWLGKCWAYCRDNVPEVYDWE